MRKALLCLLSIAVVANLLPGAAAWAQSTQVLVVPPSSTVAPGATVTVEVQVRDVLDLYAVDLRLAFDPVALEVLDADGVSSNGTQIAAGGFLSSAYGFTAVNQVDNSTGEIRYVYSLLSPAAPRSGSGVLASITLRARYPGTSALPLQALLVSDVADYIPATISDGLIVVSGDTATPTATSTSTPPAPDQFLWLPLLLRALSVPTLTPLPSFTPTVTSTPTAIPSVTPSVEHSPTPSPTTSALPSATSTVEPTSSPSPTNSITPAATRSPTPTATASPTPSRTSSVTPTFVATASPTPELRQLLLNSSFETDAAWVLEGGAAPAYTMTRAHTGARSLRLGIILPASGAVWSSVRQEVDLPEHLTEAHLSLYYYPAGWPEDTDHVYLYVTRTSDGATLFSDSWMQWQQTWHAYTVDLLSRLQPYAGQQVRVRVGVYNNGDGMTAVYLDDTELWVAGTY